MTIEAQLSASIGANEIASLLACPARKVHEVHDSYRPAHKKEFLLLTDRFDEAFEYAHQLDRTQTGKGTTIPYISHLIAIAALVVKHGGTENPGDCGPAA